MNSTSIQRNAGGGAFCTTHWSVVLAAGRKEGFGRSSALAELCRNYWRPLYFYLRRRGYSPHQSEDLTQAFFERLLEKDILADVQAPGGKFRSFLLTALKRFAANEWARTQAQKRGGGCAIVSLDRELSERHYQAENPNARSPEELFERQWAAELLERTMRRLEAECEQWNNARLFNRLQIYLVSPEEAAPYCEAGAELGMSEGAVKTAVHRLRKRYGRLLREEIGRTVSTPDEVEEEIRHLMAVLTR